MAEEKKEDMDEEKERLDNLGVGSTWDILTDKDKDKTKKDDEEKPAFRGFK